MFEIDNTRFEQLVEEGIAAIPKRFLEKLDNVDIVLEDNPSQEQIRKMRLNKNALLLGLYQGVPQTKRWCYAQVLPDKITIFKKPIEKIARSEHDIREIVKNTVWHEIAHHFGLSEKEVRKAEAARKLKK